MYVSIARGMKSSIISDNKFNFSILELGRGGRVRVTSSGFTALIALSDRSKTSAPWKGTFLPFHNKAFFFCDKIVLGNGGCVYITAAKENVINIFNFDFFNG
jgi:hypothetical protein